MSGCGQGIARWASVPLLVAVLAVVAAACDVRDNERGASAEIEGLGSSLGEIQRLARREGRVDLVIWPGYADRTWSDAFVQQTGCAVNATNGASSNDMIALIRSGGYDGVSASGDASVRLMESREVAPVNPELIPTYEQVLDGVKNQPFNSLDGQPYGVPHGRRANLLVFRTGVVPEDTDSWSVIWDDADEYSGKLSIRDDPMLIADAALYLKATRPGLGIEDPYQLNETQFQAAVGLLRRQAPHVGQYWIRDVARQVQSFAGGKSVVGTTWPNQVKLLEEANVPVKAIKPREGTTGWSDTWMIYSRAAHPNCMYLWMDYVTSPEAQARVAELLGEAPVNLAACQLTEDPDHCPELHADDEPWWDDVYYRTTPTADCGDPDRMERCMTQEDWETAWTEIRG